MHNILVHAQGSCACTRFLCMRKSLVHAQGSWVCTRFWCSTSFLRMHKILVHGQDSRAFTSSCACTKVLCMHRRVVHALGCCACTRILCMHKIESDRLLGKQWLWQTNIPKKMKGHPKLFPRELPPKMMTTTKQQFVDRRTHFVASAAPGIEDNVCNSLCN